MRFLHPGLLNLLWLLPFLYFGLRGCAQRRRKILSRFVSADLWPSGLSSLDPRRQRWQETLFLLAFLGSVLALARPQWGYEVREIKRRGLDILIVLDVSRSMFTADVKPNRLERARLEIKDFVRKLRGDRIGLVAFAGDAFLSCPLTVDYSGFMLTLDDLKPESLPRGGTNLSSALQEAIKEYDQTPSKHKVVVIMTDGENLEDDPLPVVEKARQKGIKIYAVGIGTAEGELITVRDPLGQESCLKDGEGNFVKSRLNERLLKTLAQKTGGAYVPSSGAVFGLDRIYEQGLAKLERRDIAAQQVQEYYERFQFPLGLAWGFLGLATFLPLRRKDSVRV